MTIGLTRPQFVTALLIAGCGNIGGTLWRRARSLRRQPA
jgi:hypothetical protein